MRICGGEKEKEDKVKEEEEGGEEKEGEGEAVIKRSRNGRAKRGRRR